MTVLAQTDTAPTEACRSQLVVVKPDPFHAETPLAQHAALITPTPLFYVRSNFAVPHLDAAHWRHSVEGEIAPPYCLNFRELRALILSPAAGDALRPEMHRVQGLTWSGAEPVRRVEVSADGGATWEPATLASQNERCAWLRWEYAWNAMTPGSVTLRSRTFDEPGRSQPSEPEWNRLGYANNAIQLVAVQVIA